MKIFLTVLLVLFLSGCEKNIPLNQSNIDKMYQLSIVNTRKAIIKNLDGTKIIIIATYLNPLQFKQMNNKEEMFLVGIYISNDTNKKSKDSLNPFYKISLNNDSSLDDMQKLKSNSKYLKLLPFKNIWSDYYLLKFPAKKSRTLTLTFENGQFIKKSVTFEKEL